MLQIHYVRKEVGWKIGDTRGRTAQSSDNSWEEAVPESGGTCILYLVIVGPTYLHALRTAVPAEGMIFYSAYFHIAAGELNISYLPRAHITFTIVAEASMSR